MGKKTPAKDKTNTGGRQQRQNAEQDKKQERYSPVSEFDYDEDEDGFVMIDDELRARWDGDQTKYVPLTPFQSAVSTARYSWKNLSLESVQDRLDSIGAAAANHLTAAVTGLTPQVAAEHSTPAPRAQKPITQDFRYWEPETNYFNMEEQEDVIDLQSPEDMKNEKLRRKMNDKRQNIDFRHRKTQFGQTPSPEDSLWVEREEDLNSITGQGELQYDPQKVSVQWQRKVRKEGFNDFKQRIRAEWHEKEERGTRQVKVHAEAHAGVGSSKPPKHISFSRRKTDRDDRKRIDERARDEFHQKGKHKDSAAQ